MKRNFLLILMLILSTLACTAGEIYSWTAPDGRLYMFSSPDKLEEVKRRYAPADTVTVPQVVDPLQSPAVQPVSEPVTAPVSTEPAPLVPETAPVLKQVISESPMPIVLEQKIERPETPAALPVADAGSGSFWWLLLPVAAGIVFFYFRARTGKTEIPTSEHRGSMRIIAVVGRELL
ncbi:MAG: hypothetical protein PHQ23_14560 [Candidatus Wallbacteria bacterium]|nr:hypothetical protein [Candidatus Wallbacteria bacterium]